MTANEFFERQLITDANSVIDKNAHKFSRNDLITFAEAYHKHKVKNLNIPCVSKCNENELTKCENCGDMVKMISSCEFCPHCFC